MTENYVNVLGAKYPNVQVMCDGDPSVYENLIHLSGDPIPPKEELDALMREVSTMDIWYRIKAERDMRKAGGVKVNGYWFHSDDASRIQQIALTMLKTTFPPNLQWKTMTGEFITMSHELAVLVFQTSIASDTVIFAIAENHRKQMLESGDPESYNFSGGWPMTYAESPEYVA